VRSCEKFFKELDLIIAKTEKERNKFKASSGERHQKATIE